MSALVMKKNEDHIEEDDDNDVEFLFVRSVAADDVVPQEKRARFNPYNVLVADNEVQPLDCTTQNGDGGVLLPWMTTMTCNTETKSPYLLDLLEALQIIQVFGPLWTRREADLISVFLRLSIAAQDFFSRLCYRKSLWHRFLGVVNLTRRVLIDQAAVSGEPSTNHFEFDPEKESEVKSGSQVEDSPNKDAIVIDKLVDILKELVESGLAHYFPASIFRRKEKTFVLEILKWIPGKDLEKICNKLKPCGLQTSATSTKGSRITQLVNFAHRNTIDSRFNPMRELRDAVAVQLLEGVTIQDTGFVVFKLSEELKHLFRMIMRLADLPAWSSTASTGGYVSIFSPVLSRGFLIRIGRCLPPPVVARAPNSNLGVSSSHMLPSRDAFLQMEAAHEAAACQGELLDLPVDEAMFRAKHVASHMENLGVCTLRCLPDGKVWSKDSFYTIGAELCWAALQRWYSPREEEQLFLAAEETISPTFLLKTLHTWLIERRHVHVPLPFSRQFESGCTLSTGLWNGVMIFEQDKCYMRAVLALMQILEVGFTPHRRGKYWDRLRIDLIHLSRLHKINELGSLIDKVVLVALADPAVEAGFRMKLEKSVRRRPLHLQPPPPLLPEIIDDPHVNGLYRALVQCDYMVKGCDDSNFNGYRLSANCLNTSETRGKNGKVLYVGEGGELVNVEELVLQAFYCGGLECCLPEGRLNESASGSCNDSDDSEWCGIHDEGRTMECLIPLLLWDALFQDAPLDLDCAFHSFYLNRKALLRELLDGISNSSSIDLCHRIGKIWVNRQSSLGVRWMATYRKTGTQGGRIIPGPFPWGIRLLQLVAMGLGGKAIAAICTAYAYSCRRFSSGQPDLLLLRIRRCKKGNRREFLTLNPSELLLKGITNPRESKNSNRKPWRLPLQSESELWETEADISPCMMPLDIEDIKDLVIETMLVEVKSQNDSLSAKQRAWQLILREAIGKNRAMVVKVAPPIKPSR